MSKGKDVLLTQSVNVELKDRGWGCFNTNNGKET